MIEPEEELDDDDLEQALQRVRDAEIDIEEADAAMREAGDAHRAARCALDDALEDVARLKRERAGRSAP